MRRTPPNQPRPGRQPHNPQPSALARHVADDVRALLEPQRIDTWVSPDKRPTPDGTVIYRDQIRDDTGALIPIAAVSAEERRRRAGGFQVEVEIPALLDQLEQLRDGYAAVADVGMSSGRRTPSSRPPAGADVADLLVDATVGAGKLYRDALTELHRERETTRRDRDRTVDLQPTLATTLRLLADIVDQVDPVLAKRIARQVRSWANAARVLLSVNAPMATLEWPCPNCRRQSLIVRSDASTDVLCSNDECVDSNGHRTRWPRHRWAALLASAEASS